MLSLDHPSISQDRSAIVFNDGEIMVVVDVVMAVEVDMAVVKVVL